MPKVTIENTGDAAVYLPKMDAADAVFSNEVIIVPRAKREESTHETTGEKIVKHTMGAAMVDSEVWEHVKKNKVIATYLSTGRLRVAGSAGPPPAPGPKGKDGR